MDDETLVRKYLEGDESAFREIYYKYSVALFNFIYSMVGDVDVSNDILQEVFIKVVENISSYDNINFKGWIFQIARNKVYDFFKSRKVNREISIENDPDRIDLEKISETLDPLDLVLKEIDAEKLYRAMEMLKEEEREIIFLKHFSGLKFKEISRITGKPIGSLLSKFKRSIDKLRKIIK